MELLKQKHPGAIERLYLGQKCVAIVSHQQPHRMAQHRLSIDTRVISKAEQQESQRGEQSSLACLVLLTSRMDALYEELSDEKIHTLAGCC